MALNTAKAITSFSITSPAASGIVDEDTKTISIEIPAEYWNTDLSDMTPSISHTGASIEPASGTSNDFSDTAYYTVTAADGTEEVYQVNVTIAEYNLKDIGPAGGWIFYINPNAETDGWKYMEAANEDLRIYSGYWYYEWQWGARGAISGVTDAGIGTGPANTEAIVSFIETLIPDNASYTSYYDNNFNVNTSFNSGAYNLSQYNDGTVAAKLCSDLSKTYNSRTFTDWFLPSKDEMWQMWWNLVSDHSSANSGRGAPYAGSVGGFSTTKVYFSSTEQNAQYAYYQRFSDGLNLYTVKDTTTQRVRPARRF